MPPTPSQAPKTNKAQTSSDLRRIQRELAPYNKLIAESNDEIKALKQKIDDKTINDAKVHTEIAALVEKINARRNKETKLTEAAKNLLDQQIKRIEALEVTPVKPAVEANDVEANDIEANKEKIKRAIEEKRAYLTAQKISAEKIAAITAELERLLPPDSVKKDKEFDIEVDKAYFNSILTAYPKDKSSDMPAEQIFLLSAAFIKQETGPFENLKILQKDSGFTHFTTLKIENGKSDDKELGVLEGKSKLTLNANNLEKATEEEKNSFYTAAFLNAMYAKEYGKDEQGKLQLKQSILSIASLPTDEKLKKEVIDQLAKFKKDYPNVKILYEALDANDQKKLNAALGDQLPGNVSGGNTMAFSSKGPTAAPVVNIPTEPSSTNDDKKTKDQIEHANALNNTIEQKQRTILRQNIKQLTDLLEKAKLQPSEIFEDKKQMLKNGSNLLYKMWEEDRNLIFNISAIEELFKEYSAFTKNLSSILENNQSIKTESSKGTTSQAEGQRPADWPLPPAADDSTLPPNKYKADELPPPPPTDLPYPPTPISAAEPVLENPLIPAASFAANKPPANFMLTTEEKPEITWEKHSADSTLSSKVPPTREEKGRRPIEIAKPDPKLHDIFARRKAMEGKENVESTPEMNSASKEESRINRHPAPKDPPVLSSSTAFRTLSNKGGEDATPGRTPR